jgi:hypothetical protein
LSCIQQPAQTMIQRRPRSRLASHSPTAGRAPTVLGRRCSRWIEQSRSRRRSCVGASLTAARLRARTSSRPRVQVQAATNAALFGCASRQMEQLPVHVHSMDLALERWRKSDWNAHHGERALCEAWTAFYESGGPPPSASAFNRVSRLRRIAASRLAQCMDAMRRVSSS